MDEATRKQALRALGWIATLIVLIYIGRQLAESFRDLRSHPLAFSVRWWLLVLSGAIFLAAHAVLVQTWRAVLSTWNAHLPFWEAARIWSVSNLGKYVPGKIWQIGAMSAMSKNAGISPIVASGAAILGTLLNVISGFAISLAGGRELLSHIRTGWERVTTGILIASVAGILATPFIIPRIATMIARFTGRPIDTRLPVRAVLYGLFGNIAAWLLYGFAFQLLVMAILPTAHGTYVTYLVAYTISYLFGYLAFFAPAGVGVREFFMLTVLSAAGLTTAAEGGVISLVSRLWLTLLEIAPALVFLLIHRVNSSGRPVHAAHAEI